MTEVDTNSNRSAQPSEYAALRSRLEVYDHELSQLDAKVAQVAAQYTSTTVEECLAERDKVCERAQAVRGLLHPIRRMPDELLQAIFAEHRLEVDRDLRADPNPSWQELKRSPFIFSSVTRGWRRVALGTPAHWARIFLTFTESWQEVRASALLDLHLSRSGNHELTVGIMGSPNRCIQRIWLQNQLTGIIRGRLAVLLIRGVALDVLSQFQSEHFPCLKAVCLKNAIKIELAFSDDEEEPTQTVFFKNAPMLRAFSATWWRMDWSLFTPHNELQSLAINEYTYGPDMNSFRNIVKQAPHIEDLVIIADVLDGDDLPADSPPVLLASLERITLLAPIQTESGYLHLLRLPELKRATLRIELDEGADGTTAFLRNSLPQFEYCKLHYLQIHAVKANEALANVFRQLGALEELSFVSSSHTLAFCDGLATPKEDSWLLPRLHSLTMKNHGYWRSHGAIGTAMDVGSELQLLSMIHRRQSAACSAIPGAPAEMKHCRIIYAETRELVAGFDRHLQAAMSGQLDLNRL